MRRGADELGTEVSDEVVELIARRAGGDARNALNILELASQTAMAEGQALGQSHVEDAARKRPLVYDKGGDAHYDFVSAFIKSMRGSDPDASVYYLAAMLEGGEDPRFIARRMIVLASEDIGLADPQALARRGRRGAGGRARRPAGGAAQPGRGRDLPRAGAEVERGHHGARRGGEGRPRARPRAPARRAARHALLRREEARPRPGLHLSALGSGAASTSTTCPEPLKGKKYYRPSGSGEEKGDDDGD